MNPFLPEKLGPKVDNRSSAKMIFQREPVQIRVGIIDGALLNTRKFVESVAAAEQVRENAMHDLGHLSSQPFIGDKLYVTKYTGMLDEFKRGQNINDQLNFNAPIGYTKSKPSKDLTILDKPVTPLGADFLAVAREAVANAPDGRVNEYSA